MFIFETKAKIYASKGTLWEYKQKEKTKTQLLGSHQDMTMLRAGELSFGRGVSVFLGTTNN